GEQRSRKSADRDPLTKPPHGSRAATTEGGGIGAGGLGATRSTDGAARAPDFAAAEGRAGRFGGSGTAARALAGSSLASSAAIFGFCRCTVPGSTECR